MTMAQSLQSSRTTVSNDYAEGRLLDGFLLLAAGGSSSPDDVVSVNLSSLQVVDVADEDLVFFGNLHRLDVSDNQLSYEHILQQLARLPRLGSLMLACNSLSLLQVQAGTLRHLQTLDLSFNELHGDVLAQLARLRSLTTLNLSSNCISSVPPEEELEGLQALEELILDANDLVQFIQWRALICLPRLRKLSLASNRVKRLKDDVPDTSNHDMPGYFPALEELDLSSNEITGCDCLPAVKLFRSLKVLCLSDNPCTRGPDAAEQRMRGVNILSTKTTPWYLRGSGCSQGRRHKKEPKLKLNRKKMRKVTSSHPVGSAGPRWSANQLGAINATADELLAGFRSGTHSSPECGDTALLAAAPASQGMLSDDLSEAELDQIFRERRSKIDREFNSEVGEPPSFMRPTPFAVSAAAGQKLGLASRLEDESSIAVQESPKRAPSVTPSGLFLTSMGDESLVEPTRSGSVARLKPLPTPPAPPCAPSPTALQSATPVGVTLPPIQPGSRGSSAGGGDQPTGSLFDGPRSRPMVPDISVRDAMRALRAAAMSEYAVAA